MAKRRTKSAAAQASRAEDDAGAELVASLMDRQKRATRLVVAAAFVLSLGALWFVLGDFVTSKSLGGVAYGKSVGLTAGVAFAGVFATTIAAGFAGTKAWIRRAAETERRAIVERLGLAADALMWVVGTFSPGKRGSSLDDETT